MRPKAFWDHLRSKSTCTFLNIALLFLNEVCASTISAYKGIITPFKLGDVKDKETANLIQRKEAVKDKEKGQIIIDLQNRQRLLHQVSAGGSVYYLIYWNELIRQYLGTNTRSGPRTTARMGGNKIKLRAHGPYCSTKKGFWGTTRNPSRIRNATGGNQRRKTRPRIDRHGWYCPPAQKRG